MYFKKKLKFIFKKLNLFYWIKFLLIDFGFWLNT